MYAHNMQVHIQLHVDTQGNTCRHKKKLPAVVYGPRFSTDRVQAEAFVKY